MPWSLCSGEGWSISTGSPGQFTPVWGGHFHWFFQYSIINTKKEYIDKSSVTTIRKYDPQFSEISLDSDLNLKGNIEVITNKTHKDFESYEGFKKHKFIKIEDDGQNFKGYKMKRKDTATLILPLEKIKAIKVENKTGTIIGTTAIVIPRLWLSAIVVGAIGYLVTPKGF